MEFTTFSKLLEYTKIVNNFSIGEIVHLTEDKKYVMYNGKEFVNVPEPKGEILSMNLYDLNKSIISQLPVKTAQSEQEKERNIINKFFNKKGASSYMLLCKDISYYTIFNYENSKMAEYENLGYAVLDCIVAVGDLVCADEIEDGSGIEIWVRTPDDNLCMYLFECSQLMVTYGR